jgi:ATP-dependent protease HslVU (ClpYQ) peptidase subunit
LPPTRAAASTLLDLVKELALVAAQICVYTNDKVTLEKLPA